MTSSKLDRIIDKMRPVLDPMPAPGKRARRGEGKRRPDREHTAYIAAHLPKDLLRQLKVSAAQDGKSVHDIIANLVNRFLADRSRVSDR